MIEVWIEINVDESQEINKHELRIKDKKDKMLQ